MAHQSLNGYPVAWCERGHGVFIDTDVLQSMVDEVARTHEPPEPKPFARPSALKNAPVHYVRCPTCSEVMDRKVFGGASGVMVDVCSHGTWFDAGELEQALAFASAGRMPPKPKPPPPPGDRSMDVARATLDVALLSETHREQANVDRTVGLLDDALFTIQWLMGVPVDPYRRR
jgi:Zn-finger nucleic acid-binding protein